MIEFNFYGIFSYLFYSLITSTYFSLIDEFFTELLKLLQLESQLIIYFIVALSVFLTNPYFQSLFKKRIREACLINFLTYRLNFEISRFK
ncbi:hypothetical protein F909_01712 [Acinetobacter sp. ANC 3929]|uniref:hypothetical protein n=1 Tax=unclassified Acinetobacter TaxID=196816 RepID=UPI0002D118A8|nr:MULTISPECIES: hypothetical protein [unclassified Acinetobacter]ENW82023.1 hypothetical protein F909_01712 [Acinetobacter sp. ANC 3929]MCH7352641.1 hypothetical protein [Acinetobacter sp. NIPH 2023]MCH7356687.1 hypothetical protein [Acinetobacter sp. NIPH 1958]MCH7360033.1 hypothetical protein [Acinetobacter sp. NIPH 2024]